MTQNHKLYENWKRLLSENGEKNPQDSICWLIEFMQRLVGAVLQASELAQQILTL